MTEMDTAWRQVTDEMSALLLKLKLHAQEELSEEDLDKKVGFDKLRTVVSETMDAIADAATDPAVREDAMKTGKAFIGALDATAQSIRERVRRSD